MTVLAFLHLQAFAQDKDGKSILTEEQKQALMAEYGVAFTSQVADAISKDPTGDKTDAKVSDAILAVMTERLATALEAEKTAKTSLKTAQDEKAKSEQEKAAAELKNTEHLATIATLSKKPEGDIAPGSADPVRALDKPWVPTGKDTHLFGQNIKFFAIDDDHKYNQRLYSRLMAKQGVIIPAPEASSTDYTQLKSDLGEYYRVRMFDRIQSFLVQIPDLNKIFPMVSDIQDQAVLTNVFMTEFSQAYNPGSQFANLVKGSFKFQAEIVKMYDGTFAHLFQDMKEVEKTWMGFISNDSNVIKLGLVEFLAMEITKALMNEQNIRRLKGVFVAPTANVPGAAINAADGILKRIKVWLSEFKMKAFTLGDYTPSTISSYVKRGTAMVPEMLRASGSLVLYMSTDNVSAYITNNEILYGLNQDYKPGQMVVHEYPEVKIVGIPMMAPSKRMIWTLDGNIVLCEGKAGEMRNIYFEQQDWTLKAWSNWKESIWAYLVGKKFASAAEMPDDYSTQMIFVNDIDEPADYFISMAANDVTPSVINHTSLVSVANSQATAITNIDDAVVGKEIRLKCGNATNAVTIAKAGNFSIIYEAWTPEVGEEIHLKKRSDGKFIEIKRITVSSGSIPFADGDATPSVADGDTFITVANTAPLAITNLDDAIYDREYLIYGGSDTNSSTIANAGNFVLTAAMTLAAGTYIKLVKSEVDDKFYEISRG